MITLFSKNVSVTIPRGVCEKCWHNNQLENKFQLMLKENKQIAKKDGHIKGFVLDYIKNFNSNIFLKNDRGTMFCPTCETRFPDYDLAFAN